MRRMDATEAWFSEASLQQAILEELDYGPLGTAQLTSRLRTSPPSGSFRGAIADRHVLAVLHGLEDEGRVRFSGGTGTWAIASPD